MYRALQRTATHYNTLQHTINVMPSTCNTLQTTVAHGSDQTYHPSNKCVMQHITSHPTHKCWDESPICHTTWEWVILHTRRHVTQNCGNDYGVHTNTPCVRDVLARFLRAEATDGATYVETCAWIPIFCQHSRMKHREIWLYKSRLV